MSSSLLSKRAKTPESSSTSTFGQVQRIKNRILSGPLLWLLPSVVALLLVTLYPMIYSLINSFRFYNLNVTHEPGRFVGAQNYLNAFTDSQFTHGLLLSFLFALIATTIELGIGFAVATLLNQNLRGTRVVRSLLILPVAVAPAIAGLAFRSLYDPNTGPIPFILDKIGVHPPSAGILGDSATALIGVVATDAWEWTPFAALVILAAMQGVPKDVIEAARVDGAHVGRILMSVVLPLISPILVIVLLLRFIATFNVFDIVYVETGGGPGVSTTVAGLDMYHNALDYYNIGYGSALTWIMTLIVAILINIYLLATRRAQKKVAQ